VACEATYVFYVFFQNPKKHDFLRFFEWLATFSRTLIDTNPLPWTVLEKLSLKYRVGQNATLIIIAITLMTTAYQVSYFLALIHFWETSTPVTRPGLCPRRPVLGALPTDPTSRFPMRDHKYNTSLKPCPHCRREVRPSPKTATVALFCDSVDRA